MHATPRELTKLSFKEVISSSKYKNFIFDCDGVIYNGSSHMQEAYKALNKLKDAGKNVFLLTNSSTSSRREIHDKVKRNGFDIDIEKVFTSSSLSAQYIKMAHPEIQKVYVIGGSGLVEELEAVGLTVCGHKEDDDKKLNAKTFDSMRVDEEIKAVVLGFDSEINFYKISYASALVQKGAKLIASNADPCVKRDHYKMPAGGVVVKAIEYACQKEAHLVGKPNKDVIEIAQKKFGIKLEETIMIGDSLNSDIMLGKNAGIDTFLVLTGNTSEEQVKAEESKERGIIPTYYGDAVSI